MLPARRPLGFARTSDVLISFLDYAVVEVLKHKAAHNLLEYVGALQIRG